jgi:hypothetical protein
MRVNEITVPQRLARLFTAALICGVAAWGLQFLPEAYQPSRPLYALAWLAFAGASFAILRSRNAYLASIALVLTAVFGAGLLLSLFMRN